MTATGSDVYYRSIRERGEDAQEAKQERGESMTTALQIGPNDVGREMSLEEFEQADFEEGCKYELIEGILAVSPAADFPHDFVSDWIVRVLQGYRSEHPEVVNFVSTHARVFVPGRRTTNPEPDVAVAVSQDAA